MYMIDYLVISSGTTGAGMQGAVWRQCGELRSAEYVQHREAISIYDPVFIVGNETGSICTSNPSATTFA